MFKAVNNLREQKGFTLIELLIVIAIIGILAAIAIPAFLGQREKAKQRSLEGSARGMLSELQARLDDYQSGAAMIFIVDSAGTLSCRDKTGTPVTSKNSCEKMHPGVADGGSYTDLNSVIDLVVLEHNTHKSEKNPYDGDVLVDYDTDGTCDMEAAAKQKKVAICNSTETGIRLTAFSDTGAELYNTTVSAK